MSPRRQGSHQWTVAARSLYLLFFTRGPHGELQGRGGKRKEPQFHLMPHRLGFSTGDCDRMPRKQMEEVILHYSQLFNDHGALKQEVKATQEESKELLTREIQLWVRFY